MLALLQSDLPQFGYPFDQHLVRRHRRHLVCDDVCGDVYVCGGFQLKRVNVDLGSIPLLGLILVLHCNSLVRVCMVLLLLVGVLVIYFLCKLVQA